MIADASDTLQWDERFRFRSHGLRHGGIQLLMKEKENNPSIEELCRWLLMTEESVRRYAKPNEERTHQPKHDLDDYDDSFSLTYTPPRGHRHRRPPRGFKNFTSPDHEEEEALKIEAALLKPPRKRNQDPLIRDRLLQHLITSDTLGTSAVGTQIDPNIPEWKHRLQACIDHNTRSEKLLYESAAFQKRIYSE